MSNLTFIRHGQANTGARDEGSYDQLSALGQQQATWLGQHLRATGQHYERIYCGTLIRHRQTAEAMAMPGTDRLKQDDRLNEMEFFTLANLLEQQQGISLPDHREGFVEYMPLLLAKWQAGEIAETPERFSDFQDRVTSITAELSQGRGPALVVTSGGLIGMAISRVMGLDTHGFARLCLTIMNTSVHRMHRVGQEMAMTQFNAVPHLEQTDRHFAQTHL